MPRVAEGVAPVSRAELAAGHESLRTGAVTFDRGDRARWRFTGPKAAETLTGLVTNDVLALKPGDGVYAAALTPKGKIVADLRILCDDDGLFVDTSPAAAAGWRAMTKKFINPRVVPFTEITGQTRDIGVFGGSSAQLLARGIEDAGCALDQLRPYSHVKVRFRSSRAEAMIVRAAELGDVPGFDVVADADAAAGIRDELAALGAQPASRELFDVARIEAGFPEWGADMSEDTLPQEANFDQLDAISYSKGCYIGQEVVARIHFRGHVNKTLRRVAFADAPAPPQGTELVDGSGKTVGDLRSAAVSPAAGGVGIAMVRREVSAGATLSARVGDQSIEVRVET